MATKVYPRNTHPQKLEMFDPKKLERIALSHKLALKVAQRMQTHPDAESIKTAKKEERARAARGETIKSMVAPQVVAKPAVDRVVSLADRMKELGPHRNIGSDFDEDKHPRRPAGSGETSGEFVHKTGGAGASGRVVRVKKGWSKDLHAEYPMIGARNPSAEQALLPKAKRSTRAADVQKLNKSYRDKATGKLVPVVHLKYHKAESSIMKAIHASGKVRITSKRRKAAK